MEKQENFVELDSFLNNADNGENVVNGVDHVVMDFEPKVMNLTLGDEDRSHLEVRVGRSFFSFRHVPVNLLGKIVNIFIDLVIQTKRKILEKAYK
jgi:hypothetical protein